MKPTQINAIDTMLTAEMEADAGFQTFAEELRSPGQPVIAPERFAAALHLRQQDLAQLAHVHREHGHGSRCSWPLI